MMQAILQKWKTLPREDLFLFWRKEWELKKELRHKLSKYNEIKLENEAAFHFLKHSLAYTGHREVFFTIVFFNMNSLQIQSALLAEPNELGLDFLRFLPCLIRQEKPAPHDIQFLISIYREDFQPYYAEIIQALKQEDCDYLLERTANQALRQLLKDRQTQIIELSSYENYGLSDTLEDYPEYPGLYGDKIKIIHQAIANIQTSSPENYTRPNDIDRTTALLETARLLFAIGLLDDSLALLIAIYKQEQEQVLLESEDRSLVSKSLNRILRQLLPMYALLAYPVSASQKAANIYQTFFPGLIPDKNMLYYLDLYGVLIANRSGNLQHTLIEMAQICHDIDKPNGDILIKLLHQPLAISEEDLSLLLKNVQDRFIVWPHEAYVIMEILRYLEQHQLIIFSREMATLVLNNYLQLFQWIPSPLFINIDISSQLAPRADDQLRKEVEQLLRIGNNYSRADLRDLYAAKPVFLAEEKNHLERQLVLGSFLGVF